MKYLSDIVGVVIVAFNSGDTINECLERVVADPAVHSIVVVDNSMDPITRSVCSRFARRTKMSYIPSVNVGFAAAVNIGVRELDSAIEYVCILNPDVYLARGLAELVSSIDIAGAAIVSGGLVAVGVDEIHNARPAVTIAREFSKAVFGSRAYLRRALSGGHARRVEQVDGALMVMATEKFRRLQGMDDQFELYYEDVDLCRRSEGIGGCWLVPEVWGVHAGGVSADSVRPLTYCLLRISRIRYLRKFSAGRLLGLALTVMAILEFLTRSLTRQHEGLATRRYSLGLQFAELRKPGSVWLLPSSSRACTDGAS